jgi:serine/threonine protein kinase
VKLEGRRLGRYEILEQLGQGGMGRVFLAKDSILGRQVAIKVLRDDLGLPPEERAHLYERMRIEARAVAAVNHPNVVVLHDMGDDADVGLYLVFEYVIGESLRDHITHGPLTLDDLDRLTEELASALDAAHEAGVLHRDVKPENVFLAKTGSKIGDFGIARVPDARVTRTGAGVVGTPAYAAPETLRGGDLGRRSDVFSLAATLYEAATGRRAFPGEDLLTVAAAIGTATPAPVVRSDLPKPRAEALTRALVARGMAKSPEDRFSTAGELADAVREAIGRAEVRPRKTTVTARERLPRWFNFLVGAALVAVLVVVVVRRRQDQAERALDAGTRAEPLPGPKPKPHPVAPKPSSAKASSNAAGPRNQEGDGGGSPPTSSASSSPLPALSALPARDERDQP